jgi:hypothetical protein
MALPGVAVFAVAVAEVPEVDNLINPAVPKSPRSVPK